MCYLCEYIQHEKPSLKQLDAFKVPFSNVYIIKHHLPHIAQMAFNYCPELVIEVSNEKAITTPPNSA